MKKRLLALIALLVVFPAAADVVWPALYLEMRLLTWYAIGAGLIAEYLVLIGPLRQPPLLAVGMNVAMNLASTVLGVVLLPVAGIAWEFFPGSLIYRLFKTGTFNPGTWAATIILAAPINALVEAAILRRFFSLPFSRRTLIWLTIANLVSVGIAFGSLFFRPIEP